MGSLKLRAWYWKPFGLACLMACGAAQPAVSGTEDYYSPQEIRYEDHVYSPTVHTVQMFKKGFDLSPPIIELGTGATLLLRFDDLSADIENLSYTVVLCNADWTPSDLAPINYIQGSPTDYVPTPRQSFNTLQPFLEYEVEFPNDLMRPTIAGNYLMKVFREGDPDDLVLTHRFMVFENKIQIQAGIVPTRDIGRRDTDQQLDLTVSYPGISVPDPFSDLQVAVLQNMRWDALHTGFKPKFIRGTDLIYDRPAEGVFPGGNEWRGVDLKNVRYSTMRVNRFVTSPEGLDEAILLPDEKRDFKVYLDQPDINGKYLVQNDQVKGDPLSADYIYVDFTLPRTEELYGGDVYVYGAISDFQCRKEFRCTWDALRKAYTLRVLVKQGYFDYAYAFVPAGATAPDLSRLEGTHFQTENDYVVLVYVKDYQLGCDRLLGLRFLNSRKG
jgi:hypothetical protein